MSSPASPVEQALYVTMRQMLESPGLTAKDAVWVRLFALNLIAEFELRKSNAPKEAAEEPVAA